MALYPRIGRLERRLAPANTPDGRPRCRVCREGGLRASVARFDGYPACGHHGQGSGTCAPCGRSDSTRVCEAATCSPDFWGPGHSSVNGNGK